jgi:hypothetical protein
MQKLLGDTSIVTLAINNGHPSTAQSSWVATGPDPRRSHYKEGSWSMERNFYLTSFLK